MRLLAGHLDDDIAIKLHAENFTVAAVFLWLRLQTWVVTNSKPGKHWLNLFIASIGVLSLAVHIYQIGNVVQKDHFDLRSFSAIPPHITHVRSAKAIIQISVLILEAKNACF